MIDHPMRLSTAQITTIRNAVRELAGKDATVRLFGSRLDDNLRGGDIDLLVELPNPVDNPAQLAAQISARISHNMRGRKVDVLLSAPNLRLQSIHEIAKRDGKPL